MRKVMIFILLLCLALTISVYAKPKPVNKLLGVKLGDTAAQVKKVLGKPADEGSTFGGSISKGEYGIDYERPGADRYGIVIDLNDGKVVIISVIDPSYKANVQGVKVGTDAKTVRKIFGEPDVKKTNEYTNPYISNTPIVQWKYYKYNLGFDIADGKVDSIYVYDYSVTGR